MTMASVVVVSLAGGTVAFSPPASKSRALGKYTRDIHTKPSFVVATLTSTPPN